MTHAVSMHTIYAGFAADEPHLWLLREDTALEQVELEPEAVSRSVKPMLDKAASS